MDRRVIASVLLAIAMIGLAVAVASKDQPSPQTAAYAVTTSTVLPAASSAAAAPAAAQDVAPDAAPAAAPSKAGKTHHKKHHKMREPAAAGSGDDGNESPGIAARDFLVGDEKPSGDYSAVGYLLFERKPGKDDQLHYIDICKSYLRNFSSVGEFNEDYRPFLRPTYWLLKKPLDPEKLDDCESLISDYNYSRAKILLTQLKLQGIDGPVLAAYPESSDIANGNDLVLIFDASDCTDTAIDEVFGIWSAHISYDPGHWNDGEKLAEVRVWLKSVIEAYGTSVVRAVKSFVGDNKAG